MATKHSELHKSTDQLISEFDSDSSHHGDVGYENKAAEIEEKTTVDVHNGNFILNKFLQDSMQLHNEKQNVTSKKAPVPLPRKHKPKSNQSSASSNKTYSIESSDNKITTENIRESIINVEKRQSKSSSSSNRTYSIEKDDKNKKEINSEKLDEHESLQNIVTKKDKLNLKEPKIKSLQSDTDIMDNNDDDDDDDIIIPIGDIQIHKSPTESASSGKILKRKEKHEEEVDSEVEKADDEKDEKSLQWSYKNIMGIKIHKTDSLNLSSDLIMHPVVKVHMVSEKTGEYVSKSDCMRSVFFYYENKDTRYIPPLMTRPYNLQEERSIIPKWEELLLINEDFNYILDPEKNIILFFELMDFVSFSIAKEQYKKDDQSGGWYKIAWAFLCLNARNGSNLTNTEKKIRLQLYRVPKNRKKRDHTGTKCCVFDWWQKGNYKKYPSSLSVSVVAIKAEMENIPDDEANSKSKATIKAFLKKEESVEQKFATKWIRAAFQSCKIPNKSISELAADADGCFFMKFSNDGTKLVCSVAGNKQYSIVIYSIYDFKEIIRNATHQGLIHYLCWSTDDLYLLSSSSDCTVCVWKLDENILTLLQMLPHPSFVYCSIFNYGSNDAQQEEEICQVFTAGYDKIIRIWKSETGEFELAEELEGHEGYVTSLCFAKISSTLFSADSCGCIREWQSSGTASSSNWTIKRTLKLRELEGIVINGIALHPKKEKRMLVHSRDSVLRIVDIAAGCTIQWLRGALNYKHQAFSCFSPCGSYVFAGGDDAHVCVWNADTGHSVALLEPYSKYCVQFKQNVSISCVTYHPKDHVLAVSQYGRRFPIVLMGFCTD